MEKEKNILRVQRLLGGTQRTIMCLVSSRESLFSLKPCIDFVSEHSQAQRSNFIAMAGAIMGAVLALFLITVFIIVILTARKAPSPAFTDKV